MLNFYFFSYSSNSQGGKIKEYIFETIVNSNPNKSSKKNTIIYQADQRKSFAHAQKVRVRDQNLDPWFMYELPKQATAHWAIPTISMQTELIIS